MTGFRGGATQPSGTVREALQNALRRAAADADRRLIDAVTTHTTPTPWDTPTDLLNTLRATIERLAPPVVIQDRNITPGTLLAIDPATLNPPHIPGAHRRLLLVHPSDAHRVNTALNQLIHPDTT